MNPADIGEGLLKVREAHRYCDIYNHVFENCPVLKEFQKYLDLLLQAEYSVELVDGTRVPIK